MRRLFTFGLMAAMGLGMASIPTFAQDNAGAENAAGDNAPRRERGGGDRPERPPGEGREGREGRRNMDPAQMQQRMMDRLKEELKSPDDEWALLQPKIQRVMTANREARFGGMMGGRGPGGPGGPGGGPGGPGGPDREPTTEVGKAARDLRTAVRAEAPNEGDIETKLTAYRAAQAKAAEELKAAREELKGLLSIEQEATLVLAGMLE